MPLLAGRTFFDTVDRGDYPSEMLACLCEDDLIKVLLTYIVDIYHNQPHGSLKARNPERSLEAAGHRTQDTSGSGWPDPQEGIRQADAPEA